MWCTSLNPLPPNASLPPSRHAPERRGPHCPTVLQPGPEEGSHTVRGSPTTGVCSGQLISLFHCLHVSPPLPLPLSSPHSAAELADLSVLQLMNENTAAALQYGVFRRSEFNVTSQVRAVLHVCRRPSWACLSTNRPSSSVCLWYFCNTPDS